MDQATTFIPPHVMARRLGLPEAWVRAEAAAGRIPCLRVGRRLLFNPPLVERALIEQSAGVPDPDRDPDPGRDS